MPHWLQVVAWCTPLYHAVNICRALVMGHLTPSLMGDLAWLLVAAALFAYLPVRFLRAKLAT
jgi:lipooligosaccharide transport system permease protein